MRVLYEKRGARSRRNRQLSHSWLYRHYIDRNSWLWRWRRRRWLRAAGYVCERCGASENLTVHHLTYARLGRERRADIEVLCWWCHNIEDAWRQAGGSARASWGHR